MATIKEIAEIAGVSRGTVDRVLNNRGRVAPEKEVLIRQIAEELHYSPNIIGRSLSLKKKKYQYVFCYLNSEMFPYIECFKEGVEFHAAKFADYGVSVEYLPFDESLTHQEVVEKIILPFMEENNVEGWILDGLKTDALCDYLKKEGKEIPPIITYNLDCSIENRDNTLCYVGTDYRQLSGVVCRLAGLMNKDSCNLGIISYKFDKASSRLENIDSIKNYENNAYSNVKLITNYEIPYGPLDPDYADKLAISITERSDINTLYLLNPGDYTILEYIKKHDPDHRIKIIVMDLPNEYAKNLMRQGVIDVAVCQELYKVGVIAMGYIFDLTTMTQNKERITATTSLHIIIKENME